MDNYFEKIRKQIVLLSCNTQALAFLMQHTSLGIFKTEAFAKHPYVLIPCLR